MVNILFIDDDARILKSFSSFLEREGHKVETALSGTEGIEKALKMQPDIVISDMRMPEMDGVEVMSNLMDGDGYYPGKIIFTAFDDNEALQLAKIGNSGIIRVEKDRWEIDLIPAIMRSIELHESRTDAWRQGYKLAQTEERYRQMVESVSNYTYTVERQRDRSWKSVYHSPQCLEITGYSPEDFYNQSDLWIRIVHPNDRSLVEKFSDSLNNSDEHVLDIEHRLVCRDGHIIWVHNHAVIVQAIDHEPVRVDGMVQNITARRQAEEALSESEDQMRKLSSAVDQSPVSVIITDRQGKIEYVNPAFTAITGYSSEEAIGQNPRLLASGQTKLSVYKELWKSILAGRVWRGELLNRKKGGEQFWEDTSIAPIMDAQGEITHFVAIKADVTSRKQAEDELSQATKLAAIGELASGMAHELNQPLNHIGMNCQNLLMTQNKEKLSEESLSQKLNLILNNVDRATEIIKTLRSFSRREEAGLNLVNVVSSVRDAVSMFGTQLKTANIKVKRSLPQKPVLAMAITNQLTQVMVNLISNARDALISGDQVEKRINLTVTNAENVVQIIVADNGCGISLYSMDKIYDPFFTTKEPGRGTGLGLAISHKIIRDFGGQIQVDSTEGEGATFTVVLQKRRIEDEVSPNSYRG